MKTNIAAAITETRHLAKDVYEGGTFLTVEDFYDAVINAVRGHDYSSYNVTVNPGVHVNHGVLLYISDKETGDYEDATLFLENIGIAKGHTHDNLSGFTIPESISAVAKLRNNTVYSYRAGLLCLKAVFNRADRGECGTDIIHTMVYDNAARAVAKSINPNVECSPFDLLTAEALSRCQVNITEGIDMPRIIDHAHILAHILKEYRHDMFPKSRESINRKHNTRYSVVMLVTRYVCPKGSGGIEHYYAKTKRTVKIPLTVLCHPHPEEIVKYHAKVYGKDGSPTPPWYFADTEHIEYVRNFVKGGEFGPFYEAMAEKVKAILAEAPESESTDA